MAEKDVEPEVRSGIERRVFCAGDRKSVRVERRKETKDFVGFGEGAAYGRAAGDAGEGRETIGDFGGEGDRADEEARRARARDGGGVGLDDDGGRVGRTAERVRHAQRDGERAELKSETYAMAVEP